MVGLINPNPDIPGLSEILGAEQMPVIPPGAQGATIGGHSVTFDASGNPVLGETTNPKPTPKVRTNVRHIYIDGKKHDFAKWYEANREIIHPRNPDNNYLSLRQKAEKLRQAGNEKGANWLIERAESLLKDPHYRKIKAAFHEYSNGMNQAEHEAWTEAVKRGDVGEAGKPLSHGFGMEEHGYDPELWDEYKRLRDKGQFKGAQRGTIQAIHNEQIALRPIHETVRQSLKGNQGGTGAATGRAGTTAQGQTLRFGADGELEAVSDADLAAEKALGKAASETGAAAKATAKPLSTWGNVKSYGGKALHGLGWLGVGAEVLDDVVNPEYTRGNREDQHMVKLAQMNGMTQDQLHQALMDYHAGASSHNQAGINEAVQLGSTAGTLGGMLLGGPVGWGAAAIGAGAQVYNQYQRNKDENMMNTAMASRGRQTFKFQ